MSKTVLLPDDIYDKAAELAQVDQVSINDFISAALADQLAAKEYLRQRGTRATRERFLDALDRIPDVEPEDYDRRDAPTDK